MVRIEQIAGAALEGKGITTRSLVQDFLREKPHLVDIPKPIVDDARLLAACASLIELFASRLEQEAPPWTNSVEPLAEPVFLVKAAAIAFQKNILTKIGSILKIEPI